MDQFLNDRYEGSCGMSLSARDQYGREVAWAKANPLDSSEEEKYLDRIWRARLQPLDESLQRLARDARECLVEHYQPLVHRIVIGYGCSHRGMDFLDLVQEANIALLRAFDTCPFDDLRATFAHWAYVSIRMRLRKFFQDEGGFVRLNSAILQGISDIAFVEQRYQEEFGRVPSVSELSSELGLTTSRVCDLLALRHLRFFESVEAICGQYEVPEDHVCFQEVYRSASDVEIARSDVIASRVEQALSQLPPRQREVVKLRHGLCGESVHTEAEVCTLLNIGDRSAEAFAYRGKKRLGVLLAPLVSEEQVVA